LSGGLNGNKWSDVKSPCLSAVKWTELLWSLRIKVSRALVWCYKHWGYSNALGLLCVCPFNVYTPSYYICLDLHCVYFVLYCSIYVWSNFLVCVSVRSIATGWTPKCSK
jgi:hypothetical protein